MYTITYYLMFCILNVFKNIIIIISIGFSITYYLNYKSIYTVSDIYNY